ncbi:hypothetical protein EIP86_005087 [Pleurotus ostreatoroseus]|nr:hypothetical protein EIP86_005087 [Pleurotus ostreatoroseus]
MARFDSDEICHLGLKLEGAILLVVFDVVISVTMTSLFIYPLLRNTFHHSYLRDIAKRSVCAASIALVISVINIASLAAIGGTGYGGIVLACWQGDALVSAIVFFWLTSGSGLRPSTSAATMPLASSRRRSRASTWLRRTSTTLTTLFDFSFRGDAKRQSALPTSMLDLQDPVSPTAPAYIPKEVVVVDEKKEGKDSPQTTFMTVGPQALPAAVLARRPIFQRAPPSDLSITVVATDSESAEVAGSELCMLEEEGVRTLSVQGCCCQRELARRESRS